MKFNEIIDVNNETEFPIKTKLHVIDLISQRLKKDPFAIINMDIWEILATLCSMSYDDNAYKRAVKEKKELNETLRKIHDMLGEYCDD